MNEDLAKRLLAGSDMLNKAVEARGEGDLVTAEYCYLKYCAYLARCTEYNAEMARSLKIPEPRIQNALASGTAEGRYVGIEHRRRLDEANKRAGPNRG